MTTKKFAVFCGAGVGYRHRYKQTAHDLGNALLKANLGLVYGGGHIGVMGEIAETFLLGKGEIIGVIPDNLAEKENAFQKTINKLHLVKTMSQRKQMIIDIADGFIMFPGGVGTLDEFFEAYCLAKLGFHDKPCAILNIDNFYDPIINFLKKSHKHGFIDKVSHEMLIIEEDPEVLIERMLAYTSPITKKKHGNEVIV